ncbi:hypothetical protein [Halomonas colorata]|uniref:Uncharacterized protein n=1 Tax=Halomonas colorata TaxID=2742615 RepID=A0ABR9G3C7_9GAMM|nr:hypothetical protein [Halomonas colorata]MBE0465398.1 hypothetical protein [Halomonas colorata]
MIFTDTLSKEKAKGGSSASAIYGHTTLLALSKVPFGSEESTMKKINTTALVRGSSALQHAELSQLKILEEQMLAASRYLHQQYFICQKL